MLTKFKALSIVAETLGEIPAFDHLTVAERITWADCGDHGHVGIESLGHSSPIAAEARLTVDDDTTPAQLREAVYAAAAEIVKYHEKEPKPVVTLGDFLDRLDAVTMASGRRG